MKLDEIPTWRLRQILESTKRMAGDDSSSAAVLRRELDRREADEAAAADQQQQPNDLLVLGEAAVPGLSPGPLSSPL